MDDIKDIVHKIIGDISRTPEAATGQINSRWERLLTQKELAHVRPDGLKHQTLYVNVDSPPWLYAMNLKKAALLKALKKDCPEIQRLQFKIGKVI